jgi:hypothetical protein
MVEQANAPAQRFTAIYVGKDCRLALHRMSQSVVSMLDLHRLTRPASALKAARAAERVGLLLRRTPWPAAQPVRHLLSFTSLAL